jgi:hypothetical protein
MATLTKQLQDPFANLRAKLKAALLMSQPFCLSCGFEASPIFKISSSTSLSQKMVFDRLVKRKNIYVMVPKYNIFHSKMVCLRRHLRMLRPPTTINPPPFIFAHVSIRFPNFTIVNRRKRAMSKRAQTSKQGGNLIASSQVSCCNKGTVLRTLLVLIV